MIDEEKKGLDFLITLLGVKVPALKKSLKPLFVYRKLSPNKSDMYYHCDNFPSDQTKMLFVVNNSLVFMINYYRNCEEIELEKLINVYKDYFIGKGYNLKSEEDNRIILEVANFQITLSQLAKNEEFRIRILSTFEDLSIEKISIKSRHLDFI
jgi:hypothetical protein